MSDLYKIQDREHVARKRHYCFAHPFGSCRSSAIEPGERYLRSVVVYDGQFASVAYHLRCVFSSE